MNITSPRLCRWPGFALFALLIFGGLFIIGSVGAAWEIGNPDYGLLPEKTKRSAASMARLSHVLGSPSGSGLVALAFTLVLASPPWLILRRVLAKKGEGKTPNQPAEAMAPSNRG